MGPNGYINLLKHMESRLIFILTKTPVGENAPKRFFPIFCDREELSVSSDLGLEIENALKVSRYLIIICSPNSARSKWVNKEIETFIKLGPSRLHICCYCKRGTQH